MNAAASRFGVHASRMASIFCLAMLAGCLSIPVSTLYKLSTMSEADITNLDPRDIRAVIETPEAVGIDPAKIRIGIRITSKDPKAPANAGDGEWPVELIANGRYVPIAVRAADAGRRLYLYKLSAGGEAGLSKVLAAYRTDPGSFDKIDISIVLGKADKAPADLKAFHVSAWLQLKQADGPFLLLDDVRIDVDEPKT